MKLLSTLLSHDQAICPHCETKIGLRQISEYFLKGTITAFCVLTAIGHYVRNGNPSSSIIVYVLGL